MDAIAIVSIGAVAIACLILQVKSISPERDLYEFIYIWDFENKSKLTAPFYVGLLAVVGSIIYGSFALLDSTHPYIRTAGDSLWLVGRCVIFCTALVTKAYLSPAVFGYIVCYSIYSWSTNGELQIIPAFELLLEWVFFSVSKPIHAVYIILIGVYSLGTSLGQLRKGVIVWESN